MKQYRQIVWIYSIVEVVEQKAWHCTKVPSPLQMGRRTRGEVLLLSLPVRSGGHNDSKFFKIFFIDLKEERTLPAIED